MSIFAFLVTCHCASLLRVFFLFFLFSVLHIGKQNIADCCCWSWLTLSWSLLCRHCLDLGEVHFLPSLPPIKHTSYNLRARTHSFSLPVSQSNQLRRNFLYHMLYKDIYLHCLLFVYSVYSVFSFVFSCFTVRTIAFVNVHSIKKLLTYFYFPRSFMWSSLSNWVPCRE